MKNFRKRNPQRVTRSVREESALEFVCFRATSLRRFIVERAARVTPIVNSGHLSRLRPDAAVESSRCRLEIIAPLKLPYK